MTNTRRIATIPTDALVDEKLRAGLKQNTGANNYFNWIYELCQPFLGEKILEIGAGIGDMTSCFQKIALVHATELSESSRRDLSDRFQNNPNVLVKSIDIFSPDGETYSSVVLINVLEHIQDDEKAVEKLREFIREDGYLILYSPAFWMLYSEHDRSIGHYRRYRKWEIRKILEEAGYEVIKNHYVNLIGGLGWFVYCKLLNKPANDSGAVGIMNKIVIPIMKAVEKRIRPPFGISLFTVAKSISK